LCLWLDLRRPIVASSRGIRQCRWNARALHPEVLHHRLCGASGSARHCHGAAQRARPGRQGRPPARGLAIREPPTRTSRGDRLMDTVLIGEVLSGLMFFGIIGFLMLGFPVAFTLAGVSLLFGAVGMYFGVFDPSNFGSLANRYVGFMTNEVLVA